MNTPVRPLVAVYADESCLGNGREGDTPGGAGGLIEYSMRSDDRLVRRDYWVSERNTTNNRMALQSAICAGELLFAKGKGCDIRFVSDSQYLIKGMREWVHGWAARGWSRKTGAIENLELWQEAIRAMQPHHVQWQWIRGHDGHPQNEYANFLATRAAADGTASSGLVESAFSTWEASERGKGRLRGEVHPPPTTESFRPDRALPHLDSMRPNSTPFSP